MYRISDLCFRQILLYKFTKFLAEKSTVFCLWNYTCNICVKTTLRFCILNTADQDSSIINYIWYHIFYDNACSYYVQNRCLFGFDRCTNHVLLRYFAMRCCNLFYELCYFSILHKEKLVNCQHDTNCRT